MKVVSTALWPAVTLVATALVGLGIAVWCFTAFGVLHGLMVSIVCVGLAPLPFMTLVGKSSIASAKAPWGTISVGADGILLSTLVGATYHAFECVRFVTARGSDRVIIELVDGTRLELACEDSFALEHAIEDAWLHYRNAMGGRRAELERRDESLAGYLGRIRALIQGGGFRARPLSEHELVAVAVDPKSSAAQRVGAVAALEEAPEPIRVKLRVAVEATAEPTLRLALEEALAGQLSEARMATL